MTVPGDPVDNLLEGDKVGRGRTRVVGDRDGGGRTRVGDREGGGRTRVGDREG